MSLVYSGGRYLIYETGAQGLVVAAMLERIGGKTCRIQNICFWDHFINIWILWVRYALGKLKSGFRRFSFQKICIYITGALRGGGVVVIVRYILYGWMFITLFIYIYRQIGVKFYIYIFIFSMLIYVQNFLYKIPLNPGSYSSHDLIPGSGELVHIYQTGQPQTTALNSMGLQKAWEFKLFTSKNLKY